eukprot:TRINITY_DN24203_c0_g2_i1.p5 TRINITY_DN24203_c0_g2~~TRINITY_DN24203_c0_g2_i1.p5  ORF type:complete len:100 (+),score=11.00 TRINITY_DN24203_c0_g2_i1:411-710(+)
MKRNNGPWGDIRKQKTAAGLQTSCQQEHRDLTSPSKVPPCFYDMAYTLTSVPTVGREDALLLLCSRLVDAASCRISRGASFPNVPPLPPLPPPPDGFRL